MRISVVALKNFRGYEQVELSLEKGLNVLVGNNGAGKTNLVEAISFLSIARSFRTNDEKELRKKDTSVTWLKGVFLLKERKQDIEMLLVPKGKKITCNGHEVKKISELVSNLHVIVFKPSDVFIFDAAPSERRRFMNVEISRQYREYLLSLTRYEKILEERNKLLKQDDIPEMQLDSLTELMIQEAYLIVRYRKAFFERLKEATQKITEQLGEIKQFQFTYCPFIGLEDFVNEATNAFKKAKENDLRMRATTIGPHREDFVCTLNGTNISASGSQGEKRLAALILKLALYPMVQEEAKKPIVILDDVLSELDEQHQKALLKLIDSFEQTILTTTEWKWKDKATVYDVEHHTIKRRIGYGR